MGILSQLLIGNETSILIIIPNPAQFLMFDIYHTINIDLKLYKTESFIYIILNNNLGFNY